jgi:PAS domain S-box-containing protein
MSDSTTRSSDLATRSGSAADDSDHYLKRELYERVRADQDIFEFLQHGSLDGVWFWDLERPENEWMSPRFWQLFGHEPTTKKHLAAEWQDMIHPEDLRAAIENFQKHCADPGHPYDQYVRYRHSDGSTVWVRCRGLAIRDPSGKPVRMLGAHSDVTALKRLEQDLASQHAVLECFFAISLDMLCIAGVDGYFKRISPAFDVLGYSRDELLSRPFLDFVHPDDKAATLAEVAKLTEGTTTIHFENRYRCKDGTYRWLSWTSAPDASGTLYAIARDVTDAKHAEESLREANQFLEAVIENIPHMVFVKDAEQLAFVRFNRAGEELLGVPRSDLLGKKDHDFFPIDEAEFFQAKDRETLNRRLLLDIPEEPIKTSRGQRLLHTKKVPIVDGSGTPRYLLGISEDISDRKAEEEARARLAAIVDNSDDAIIGRTLDGIVTSWNGSAERIFGYSAEEMIGRSIAVLFPAHRKDEEEQLTERIGRGERIANFETVRRRKDGLEIDVSTTLSPVRDSTGKLIGISKIARDITDLKRIQQELVRAKEAAEASNRELESFSYSVAHDLRAPLRSIDGFSQALLEDYDDRLDEDGRKYLRFVRESSQLMAQLIDDMLTLSRVARQNLDCSAVDLSALARATRARLERNEPRRDVELVIQEGLVGHGDARLLAVVLDNLLGNAWKFTSKRTGACIEFGETTEDGARAYFVRDNGAGFDMNYASKLFGVFQRLHATRDFEGTGVGLATVQRIVHRHGGRVWAEGKVDAGATFYFNLGEKE